MFASFSRFEGVSGIYYMCHVYSHSNSFKYGDEDFCFVAFNIYLRLYCDSMLGFITRVRDMRIPIFIVCGYRRCGCGSRLSVVALFAKLVAQVTITKKCADSELQM